MRQFMRVVQRPQFGKLLNAWNAKQGGKLLSFRGEH
jgi:hypothetical protein